MNSPDNPSSSCRKSSMDSRGRRWISSITSKVWRSRASRCNAATDSALRAFFYLPFEHAENLALQDRSVTLITPLGDPEFTRYAIVHREIIARFGRFPHRNPVLGRASTEEELRFLAEGGFSG